MDTSELEAAYRAVLDLAVRVPDRPEAPDPADGQAWSSATAGGDAGPATRSASSRTDR